MPVLDQWVVGIVLGGLALYLGASLLLGIAPHARRRLRKDARDAREARHPQVFPITQDGRRQRKTRIYRPRNQSQGMQG